MGEWREARAKRAGSLDWSRSVLRPIDLERADADLPWALRRRRRVGRGLYVSPGDEAHPVPAAFVLSLRHPDAIVCLLSALELQGIRPLSTSTVWLARPNPVWRPRGLHETRVEAVRFDGRWARLGVEMMVHRELRIAVTGVARTVADLVAYRRRVGMDAAVHALEEVVRLRACSTFDLERMLRARRVHAYARPLLRAALKRWPQPPHRASEDYQRYPWLPTPALAWSELPRNLRFPWSSRGYRDCIYAPICFYEEPRRSCACRFLTQGMTLDGRPCDCTEGER